MADEFDEFDESDKLEESDEFDEFKELEDIDECDECGALGGVGGPLKIELAVESVEDVLVLSPHAVKSKNADDTMSTYKVKFFISFSRKVYIVVIPL